MVSCPPWYPGMGRCVLLSILPKYLEGVEGPVLPVELSPVSETHCCFRISTATPDKERRVVATLSHFDLHDFFPSKRAKLS